VCIEQDSVQDAQQSLCGSGYIEQPRCEVPDEQVAEYRNTEPKNAHPDSVLQDMAKKAACTALAVTVVSLLRDVLRCGLQVVQ